MSIDGIYKAIFIYNYNMNAIMNAMEFADWINNKFLEWQQQSGRKQTQKSFARFLGVPSASLSDWMNGKYTPEKYIDTIANRYPEVYEIFGKEITPNYTWIIGPLDPENPINEAEFDQIYKRAEEILKHNDESELIDFLTEQGLEITSGQFTLEDPNIVSSPALKQLNKTLKYFPRHEHNKITQIFIRSKEEAEKRSIEYRSNDWYWFLNTKLREYAQSKGYIQEIGDLGYQILINEWGNLSDETKHKILSLWEEDINKSKKTHASKSNIFEKLGKLLKPSTL